MENKRENRELTPAEVAKVAGVSKTAVYKAIYANPPRLDFRIVGKKTYLITVNFKIDLLGK